MLQEEETFNQAFVAFLDQVADVQNVYVSVLEIDVGGFRQTSEAPSIPLEAENYPNKAGEAKLLEEELWLTGNAHLAA